MDDIEIASAQKSHLIRIRGRVSVTRKKINRRSSIQLPNNSKRLMKPVWRSPARRFFASLRWNHSGDDIFAAVFSESELSNMPLKWLKYLLLERVGLTSQKDLDATIHRFDLSDTDQALNICNNLFGSKVTQGRTMAVFKAIFFDRAGQLPNYRIYSLNDVPLALKFLQEYRTQSQEAWICASNVDDSGSNFGGRITLPIGKNLFPSSLEIVWYTSPRKIEEFSDDTFPYPFLRASKHLPSLQFVIEKLYIPEKYLRDEIHTILLQDTQKALSSLHYLKESIEILQIILCNAGANEISLEFKVSYGKFSIIDWDTEIETSL